MLSRTQDKCCINMAVISSKFFWLMKKTLENLTFTLFFKTNKEHSGARGSCSLSSNYKTLFKTLILTDQSDTQLFKSRHTILFYSILFYSILFFSRPYPSTAGGCPPPEPPTLLVHTTPCCPTMSCLQRRICLPTDLKPFICHSVLLMVHLLSFIRTMCPAHFHFTLVTF